MSELVEPFRADHVGGFARPAEILHTRELHDSTTGAGRLRPGRWVPRGETAELRLAVETAEEVWG